MRLFFYFFAAYGYLVMCGTANAATTESSPDIASAFIRMISVLAFIIGIILILTFILRKINFSPNRIVRTGKCLEIIETLYLGPKKSIAVIKAGNEFLLIGLSANHVNFLSKIDITVTPNDFSQGRKQSNFKDQLASVLTSFNNPLSTTQKIQSLINQTTQETGSKRMLRQFQAYLTMTPFFKRHV
jgi:flagellar protein FliO/FliZ